jgi:uncharacterized protein (DUF433 family)
MHIVMLTVAGGEHAMQVETMIRETPGVSGGYPCVGDTRVRVALVVQAFDQTADVVATAERFDLTIDQVRSALDYYESHRGRIEADIARNQARARGK